MSDASLGPRPRDSLVQVVVHEDVKKPTNQPTNQINKKKPAQAQVKCKPYNKMSSDYLVVLRLVTENVLFVISNPQEVYSPLITEYDVSKSSVLGCLIVIESPSSLNRSPSRGRPCPMRFILFFSLLSLPVSLPFFLYLSILLATDVPLFVPYSLSLTISSYLSFSINSLSLSPSFLPFFLFHCNTMNKYLWPCIISICKVSLESLLFFIQNIFYIHQKATTAR